MDGARYRSYVVRVWLADPLEPAETRVRVEWIAPGIAPGIEVESRGARAAELAARLDQVFDADPPEKDGTDGDHQDTSDRGRH